MCVCVHGFKREGLGVWRVIKEEAEGERNPRAQKERGREEKLRLWIGL